MPESEQRPSPLDLSSIAQIGITLQKSAFEMAQANTKMTFEYVTALMGCRSPNDVARVTTEFTKKQMDAFQQQAKELVDLAARKNQ